MRSIDCPCGTTMEADTDDELVPKVKQHIDQRHPEMKDTADADVRQMVTQNAKNR